MKADAIALTKLYDTLNKAYVIPAYQRPFAWDPKKAIDVLESVLDDANAKAKITSLGTLLFCEVPVGAGALHPFGNNAPLTDAPNTIWEVVDGQQRLTVFAIIGFALKKRLEDLTAMGLQYSPLMEFELLFLTSRRKTGKNVPVLIRDEDNFDTGYQSDLARLLNSFAGNEHFPPEIGKQLRGTLEDIRKWVDSKLDKTTFVLFCDYLLSRCQIIQVLADDQDAAFMMFEPLNSTSEPLTAFEVYRSKAVRSIQPLPDFTHTLGLLDYDNNKRDEVIKRSNTLIFAMSQVFSGQRPRVHFVQLKQYLDQYVTLKFIRNFETSAVFFSSIWFNQTSTANWFDEETKTCIRFLKASNHDAAIPVILRYFLADPAQVPMVLKIIVAFYSLWRPVSPTNMLPDTYRNLLKTGQPDNMAIEGGTLKSPQDLAAYFRVKLEDRLGPPQQDQTFEDLWLANQPYLEYDQLKTICRLFVFLDMGASIKSNLVPNDPWTSLDDIEHLLPQSIQPTPSNIDRLGNLTFLTGKLNRSIQDAPWIDKREIYTHLASTQRLNPPPTRFADGRQLPKAVREYLADPQCQTLAHLQAPSFNANWDENEINLRTMAMLKKVWKVLHTTWLHPP